MQYEHDNPLRAIDTLSHDFVKKAMDCASLYNLDRAILLVLESVFDELLTLEACRVMEAEISFRRRLR